MHYPNIVGGKYYAEANQDNSPPPNWAGSHYAKF